MSEPRNSDIPQFTAIYADLDSIVQTAERAINLLHDAEVGRAVQDDGLDVERLRKCPTLMVLLNRYGTFNDAWWDRLADEYRRAAPPLHDPEEPK